MSIALNEITPVELTFEETTITCPLEEGHRMVPVKMVCQIIDVDFQTQDNWLKKHNFFSQLYRLAYTTGADGKQYEMRCLSIFDIGYWLGSITNNNRRTGSIEKQARFMMWLREQTMLLYKSIDLFMKENKYELELLEMKSQVLDEMDDAKNKLSELKKKIKEIDSSIEEVREKRFTGQTALPFPDITDN